MNAFDKVFEEESEEVNGITVLKAPQPLPIYRINGVVPKSIFLAGSIDMDKAEDWQTRVTKQNYKDKVFQYILNPRRDDWNETWIQSIKHEKFFEQVSWEHTAMEISEKIIFYFDPKGQAPITLMELGMFATSGKCKVVCPDGYWRKGNVEVLCHRHSIKLFNTLEEYFSTWHNL